MHHTQALILKREERGEADWWVSLLSRDFGKIRLLAQGARKHGAKLRGHLETGSIAAISFVVGRNGYRLTTARLNESFPNIHSSLSKLRARAEILAALDHILWEERDGSRDLFEIVASTCAAFEGARRQATLERSVAWFHARFLKFLGLLPAAESPEANEVRSILAIGSTPIGEIDGLTIPEDVVASELVWLSDHLLEIGPGVGPRGRSTFAVY